MLGKGGFPLSFSDKSTETHKLKQACMLLMCSTFNLPLTQGQVVHRKH